MKETATLARWWSIEDHEYDGVSEVAAGERQRPGSGAGAENRRLRDCAQHPHSEGEDPASAQQLRELYEQALRDLQDRQQELEASARRVEELGREREEDRKLHDATVKKMAELEEEIRRVVEQKADLQRRCERQELDRYRALEAQREKWKEREARLV